MSMVHGHIPGACPYPCGMSMVHVYFHNAWPSPCCVSGTVLHVYVHASYPFHAVSHWRCCMSMSMLHVIHIDSAFLCLCCMSMSMRHIHVLVNAAWPRPCSCCLSMSMLHVHVHAACPCPCCMSTSIVFVQVHAACSGPCPSCMSMLHSGIFALYRFVSHVKFGVSLKCNNVKNASVSHRFASKQRNRCLS